MFPFQIPIIPIVNSREQQFGFDPSAGFLDKPMIGKHRFEMRRIDLLTAAICCLVVTVPRRLPSVAAFSTNSHLQKQQQHCLYGRKSLLVSTTECEPIDDTGVTTKSKQPWLDKGLILSSFTDGLKTNPPAIDWLMQALVESLWTEQQASTQSALYDSNLASPCNGPDPVLLEQLEATDKILEGLQEHSQSQLHWKDPLRLLCKHHESLGLRILYIPTAMYALRPNSTSKPGKQRGRNRADGKKRRNEIVHLVTSQLEDALVVSDSSSKTRFTVSTVTLDFDDASVKQPEQVVVGVDSEEAQQQQGSFPEVCRLLVV